MCMKLKRCGLIDSMEKWKPAECQEGCHCQSDKVDKTSAASFEMNKSCVRLQLLQPKRKGWYSN